MKWKLGSPAHPEAGAERRTEERVSADGQVRFSFEDPMHATVDGLLVDHSRGGFRATHDCTRLSSGQLVEFEHDFAGGFAKVVWNRITGSRVESGFLITEPK